MILTFKNIVFLFFFLIVNWPVFKFSSQAQNNPLTERTRPDIADIQWIGQWPSPNQKFITNASIRRMIDFILGEKILKLSKPVSILAENQDKLWILDQGNNTVFQVRNGVGKIPHFIDKKKPGFSSLVELCDFHNNEFLFTDSYLNKIYLVNPEKKEFRILNDSLILEQPTGIAYSKIKNEIWVVETAAHRISVLDEKGQLIKRIGSRGNSRGQFNFPTYVWIDKQGKTFVVDAMNYRIQVFSADGEAVSAFGSNGDATGFFACPKGIATDSYGHIYIVDALFHVVQIFDINGVFLFTFGGQGHMQGQFWMPSGIYIDDSDKIYIADSYNSRIQIFQIITPDLK